MTPEETATVEIMAAALRSLYDYVDAEHGPRKPGTFLFGIMDSAKFALDFFKKSATLEPSPAEIARRKLEQFALIYDDAYHKWWNSDKPSRVANLERDSAHDVLLSAIDDLRIAIALGK